MIRYLKQRSHSRMKANKSTLVSRASTSRWLIAIFFSCIAIQWGRPIPSMTLGNLLVILWVLLTCSYCFFYGFKKVPKLIFTFFALYLLVILVTSFAYYAHDTPEGFRITRSSVLYVLALFLLVSLGPKREDFALYARVGMATAIGFLVASSYNVGISFHTEFPNWLINYNYQGMLFHFYRSVFNAFSDNADFLFTGTRRNQFSTVLLFFVMLWWAGSKLTSASKITKVVDLSLVFLSLVLLLTMSSRTSFIILFLAILVHFVSFNVDTWRGTTKVLVTFVVIVLALFFVINSATLLELVDDRLYSGSISTQYRADQIQGFFGDFNFHLLTGVGFYTTDDGSTIHNFILSNWAAAGFFGLVFSSVFLFWVGWRLLKALSLKQPSFASLILILLIKAMIAGNAGYPELASLCAVVICLLVTQDFKRNVATSKNIRRNV